LRGDKFSVLKKKQMLGDHITVQKHIVQAEKLRVFGQCPTVNSYAETMVIHHYFVGHAQGFRAQHFIGNRRLKQWQRMADAKGL
jgi:hypothetical protein